MAKRRKRRVIFSDRGTDPRSTRLAVIVDLSDPGQVTQAALVLLDFAGRFFQAAGRDPEMLKGCSELIRDTYRELQGKGAL